MVFQTIWLFFSSPGSTWISRPTTVWAVNWAILRSLFLCRSALVFSRFKPSGLKFFTGLGHHRNSAYAFTILLRRGPSPMTLSFSRLKRLFHFPFSVLLSQTPEEPIRSELFSLERFDQHARSLAVAQTITDDPKSGVPLTPRLRQNEKILQETFRYLTGEVQKKKPINPAGEWLIDSFYVVEEQLRDIKRYLPHDFYNELPKLSDGFLKGYPRVYGLAWAYVAHTDSHFDSDSLAHFV